MEYFDLYDKQGRKLNRTMARGTNNSKGEYHKVVHVWIKNSRGEYLVQQRNKATDDIPYQWAPTAGACTTGEKGLESAVRETYEEIGVLLHENDLIYKGSIFRDDPRSNYLIEMYLVNRDIPLTEITIDEVEVRDVAYFTKQEILRMVDANTFWDFRYIKEYFSILEKS